jgi:hypothetical protein
LGRCGPVTPLADAGLKVLTTRSSNNADYVRDVGANVAIDHHPAAWQDLKARLGV